MARFVRSHLRRAYFNREQRRRTEVNDSDLAYNVRGLRKYLGLSLDAFARRLGWDYQVARDVEAGKIQLSEGQKADLIRFAEKNK